MKEMLFTGGYTQTAKGIYCCEFDTQTGRIKVKTIQSHCENPNFIALDHNRNLLLALNENEESTWITSYGITQEGGLAPADKIEIGGRGPCHISVDERDGRVFYANYESGEIGAVFLEEEGKFSGRIQKIQHTGSSVAQRQESPHPHGVHVLAEPGLLLVPDLGTDEVKLYDISNARMELADVVRVRPGDGPRHAVSHPDGRKVYLICELQNVIYTYVWNKGKLEERQRISLLPPDAQGEYIAGEIAVTADGSHLIASTRAWGSRKQAPGYLSVFRIEDSGCLRYTKSLESGGSHPRMFLVTKDDRYVLVANQYSDSLTVFRTEDRGENLTECASIAIPEITCVLCR